jgi:hypothetical protein
MGGYIPIWENVYLSGGLNYIGFIYKDNIVYEVIKTVQIPFIGKKEVVVPIKLGKTKFDVYYDGAFNIDNTTDINFYNIVRGNFVIHADSNFNFNAAIIAFYKNYGLMYSSENSIISIGFPLGISLKYSPFSLGICILSDKIGLSANLSGIDLILISENVKIFINTEKREIAANFSIPLK